jgi:uncharacterized damage-inducible protein DinB
MISETARIADQLRRSYHGEAWHGPSLSELLEGVTAAKAQAHPISSVHSIWEIVLHITLWERLTLGALQGRALPQDESDWPAQDSIGDAGWQAVLDNLRDASDQLVAAIETFPVSRLEDVVPGRQYSFAFLLHGVIQHNLYHAGQIAILRKGSA